MAEEKIQPQFNKPDKKEAGIESGLDACITMLSGVNNLLAPGRDINQYTSAALGSCYRNTEIVFNMLTGMNNAEDKEYDDDLENIRQALAEPMRHLKTSLKLKKEHEGIDKMEDETKSKGDLFDECTKYSDMCFFKLEQVIKDLKRWKKNKGV